MISETLTAALLPILSYLLGAVPFALLLGWILGVDLRRDGTGNVGAGNLTKVSGLRYGLIAAFLDGLKGVVPIVVARRLGLNEGLALIGGVAAVVGHNWSIYLRGRAGRGLATAAGVVAAAAPLLLLWAGFWAVAGWKIGGGPGGFIGWVLLGPLALATAQPASVTTALLLISAVVAFRRMQGAVDAPSGWRPALARVVWDTDRLPELGHSEEKQAY